MEGVENPALTSATTAEPENINEDVPVAAIQPALPATRAAVPVRPALVREGSTNSAPPPQQPPPAPPVGQQPLPPLPPAPESIDFSQEAPDSLTLADLKRIRSNFLPNAQPPRQQLQEHEKVYDFDYQDAQSFPVELEEWFSYSEEEESKLRACRIAFNEEWRKGDKGYDVGKDWLDVTEDARREFLKKWIGILQDASDEQQVAEALQILTYLALGIWEETAGRQEGFALEELFGDSKLGGSRLEEYGSSSLQIQWIVAMVDTIHSCNGLKTVYDTLRRICDRDFQSSEPEMPSRNELQVRRGEESTELWCCLTLMYLFVEVARTTTNNEKLKACVLDLEPNFLNCLTQIVARLRWDEQAPIPLTKMLLLAWKAILVSFGGISDVEALKATLREGGDPSISGKRKVDDRGQPIITASPLDYHLFRQEINSKYPAYQPPAPLFPLEPENNSILPPLKHRRPSLAASSSGAASGVSTSIMHQPVHIATPAPSPPPSPAAPGKAGKKQNYQTNQMFPFLYPPLDASSNALGGKGSTELQDALVGRKWGGSDVPTSILEAAELFAGRCRATRAMRQLWDARNAFMEEERGWKGANADHDADVDELDLADNGGINFEETAVKVEHEPNSEAAPERQEDPSIPADAQRLLDKVNEYYRDSLPHLHSVVIILLKTVLSNVTDLVTKGNGANGLQAGIQFNDINNGPDLANSGMDSSSTTAEELDKLRTQEIVQKALSGILILLCKWFKVSNVLQYEYFTQLLLDSNYVPLVLKLWQTQDIGRACHYRVERTDKSFWYLCQASSRRKTPSTGSSESDEEDEVDDAVPPPIKLKRDPSPQQTAAGEDILSPTFPVEGESPEGDHGPATATYPPEIDELGYPTSPLPALPIKNYSFRNLFSSINLLRVLQKVTRRKTHRALLLVSYKSSNHLKKGLRIPVNMLRLYTLKLFKSQVPFCGRKWRQGNMRIITGVWLGVRSELRDDWLCGGGGGMGGGWVGDVDGSVEDALPLEQSLRSLTHWWNVRNYPQVMGVEKGGELAEADYFARELKKIEGREGQEGQEEFANREEGWCGPIEGY